MDVIKAFRRAHLFCLLWVLLNAVTSAQSTVGNSKVTKAIQMKSRKLNLRVRVVSWVHSHLHGSIHQVLQHGFGFRRVPKQRSPT
jgi:hypothetical protein